MEYSPPQPPSESGTPRRDRIVPVASARGRARAPAVIVLHGAGSRRRTTPTTRAPRSRTASPRSPSTTAATARPRATLGPGVIDDLQQPGALRSPSGPRWTSAAIGRARLEHGRAARDPRRRPPATRSRRRSRSAPPPSGCCSGRAAAWPTGKPPPPGSALDGDADRRPGARRPGSRSTTSARQSSDWATKPLLLIHARGDEVVPYQHSEELYERAAEPKRLLLLEGGDHRSAQHDAELQGESLRWLMRAKLRQTGLRRAAGLAARARAASHSRRPTSISTRLSSCGAVRPATHLVVAAHELDQEALEPGQHQVEREQHARAQAVAQLPQHPCDEAHRERLVDRRRVHLSSSARCRPGTTSPTAGRRPRRSRRHRTAGSRSGRSRSRARAARRARSSSARPRKPRHQAQAKTASAPPIAPPYQTRPDAGEEVAEAVVADVVPVLDQVVDARADEPADERRRRSSRRPSRPACRAPSKRRAMTAPAADEAEREHEPEGLERRAGRDGSRAARPAIIRRARGGAGGATGSPSGRRASR